MRRLVAVVAVVGLVAAACGGAATVPPSATPGPGGPASTSPPSTGTAQTPAEVVPVRADVPRATATDVTDDELAALVAGDTAFAFDLYRRTAGDTNLVLSPYSVAAALTMTYAGARGDTAAQMRDVLHLGLGDDRIHTARNELDLRITAPVEPAPGDDRQPFTLRVANSLWGQQGYPFLDEFLTLLAENYGAGMNLVDFVGAAEEARQTINAWVERETEGRITDLIPEGVIDDLTRLVLVNAIWFKANWQVPFDPALTADAAFTTVAGDEVTVPMMAADLRTDYVEGDGYAAVRLRYAGDASMLVVVPDPGRFDDVASRLDPDLVAEIDRGLAEHQVDLRMPRFSFRANVALADVLKELGMVAAFTEPSLPGGADFTGMAETRELFIKAVAHQAFIAVDEEGTEAAAATAVVVGLESLPPPATLDVDRPFLFLIRHDSTGEILFLGQVTDPSAG